MGGTYDSYNDYEVKFLQFLVGAAIAASKAAQLASQLGDVEDQIDDVGEVVTKINWPPNGGVVSGTEKNVVLTEGYKFDRFGYNGGTYVAPEGIPYEMRSLAPGTETKPYKIFEVIKSLRAKGGITAPWFDQPGGGIQFELEDTIENLLEANKIM